MTKEQKRIRLLSHIGAARMLRNDLEKDGLIAATDEADILLKGLCDDLREFEFGRIDLEPFFETIGHRRAV